MILDVFSRYVVGWMFAPRESAALAETLIVTCRAQECIGRNQLTSHADRGASMTSKPVALLLAELGITKSHSRPHVSNDNPYSEAHFKTFKYRPDFPARFGALGDARALRRFPSLVHHRPSSQLPRTARAVRCPSLPRRRPPCRTRHRAHGRIRHTP